MKNRKIRVLFAVILSISFILSSCGDEEPVIDIHTTDVVNNYGIGEYGNYVYYGKSILYKLNRKTGERSKVCMDPECSGRCIFEKTSQVIVLDVCDNKMFFRSWYSDMENIEDVQDRIVFGYQNIITGEVTILVSVSYYEMGLGFGYVYDGYLYYARKLLREGGDAKNYKDYVEYICRININGGEEECLKASDGEVLVMVAGGNIITMYQDIYYYSYDMNLENKRTLFECKQGEYFCIFGGPSYIDGKLFFLCKSYSEMEISEYRRSAHYLTYLITVDLETGESKRAVEGPVTSFCVTNDAIYYTPFELRHLYIPSNYEEHPGNVLITLCSPNFHRCDLSGENDEIVYTNEYTDLISEYTVVDDKVYGWVEDYYPDSHTCSHIYFAVIDLKTGELTSTVPDETT